MAEASVMATVVTAASAMGVAALTGLVSYRITRWNIRKEFEIELRKQRLDAFKKLWAISQPLALYGRKEPVTRAVISRLAQDLRQWYFEEGGMFLSDASRDKYMALQESLQKAIRSPGGGAEPVAEPDALDAKTFEGVRQKGSELRSALRESFGGFPQM